MSDEDLSYLEDPSDFSFSDSESSQDDQHTGQSKTTVKPRAKKPATMPKSAPAKDMPDYGRDALNKHSSVIRSGQTTLDGKPIYEEVKEVNVKYTSTHHPLNISNLDTFIYPANLQVRKYQEQVVTKALLENVLCSLPTGLGKTFIAAAVMLNFYRWVGRESTGGSLPVSTEESQGKIIFMAPTRPLVAQQMRACYGIAGLPLEDTALLVGVQRKARTQLWRERRVFFSTPQLVANDLRNGIVDPRTVCCIVVDEAHRARGGSYAYCVVVKTLEKFNTSFRVLALTATPGSDVESVQRIVDNLSISHIELRTDQDPDVKPYINSRSIDQVDCAITPEIDHAVQLISAAILPVLKRANAAGIYDITDPARINRFHALEKSRAVVMNHSLPEGAKWTYFYQLRLLSEVGDFLRRLKIYGLKTFYSYFCEKYDEFTTKYELKKSTNRTAASFYFNKSIKELKTFVGNLIENDVKRAALPNSGVVEGLFSHSKFQELVKRVISFLEEKEKVRKKRKQSTATNDTDLNFVGSNSSIIIFTELRENALDIVRCLESANKLVDAPPSDGRDLIRPHIFIGQAKEKDKFDQVSFRKKSKKSRRGKKAKESSPAKKGKNKRNSSRSDVPTTRVGSSEMAQSKGMTQKDQKELLSKFKSGIYNILVATSIGEEGLDIGEVDMIVCFDSTSSPIKNIQRMGRTGRKRAGTVLMLFSSNERDKFARAMDNYRWIQNNIRSGKAGIALHPSDRIVPKQYNPRIVYKRIEIPKQNKRILEGNGDDDEALLRTVATETSVKKNRKRGKKKRGKKADKDELDKGQMKLSKRFFMPDNVHTGFRPASSMVKVVSKTKKMKEEELSKPDVTLLSESSENDDNDLVPSQLFSSSPSKKKEQKIKKEPKKDLSPSDNSSKKDLSHEKNPVVIDLSQFTDDELHQDEFDFLQQSTQMPSHETKKEPRKPSPIKLVPASPAPSIIADSEGEDEDEKPLGLSSMVISSSVVNSDDEHESNNESCQSDIIVDNKFSPRAGFMTPQQEIEFYSRHFTNDESAYYDPANFNVIDDPLICVRNGGSKYGKIAHSTKSKSLIQFYKYTKINNDNKP